jgi:NAD(P)H-nitrite reductase large subunit
MEVERRMRTICMLDCIAQFYEAPLIVFVRDDDTPVCSCHNVTKGNVASCVRDKTCKSIGQVKSHTKAGTGCGGCMPIIQSIFNKTMLEIGQEVSNHSKCLLHYNLLDYLIIPSMFTHTILSCGPFQYC